MRLLASTILALSLGAIGVHCCAPMPIGTPLKCEIRDCRKEGCTSEPIKCSLNQPVDEKYVRIGKTSTDNELFCEKGFKPERDYSIGCEAKGFIWYSDTGMKVSLQTEMSSCENDMDGREPVKIMVDPIKELPLKIIKPPVKPPPKIMVDPIEELPQKVIKPSVEPPPKFRQASVKPPKPTENPTGEPSYMIEE